MSAKPIPNATAESRPFWDAAASGRLLYQWCKQCERAQFYPRLRCSNCGADEIQWRESSARGTVHAVTEVHVAAGPFKAEAPYTLVLVDLEEGFRMLVNAIGKREGIAIGDRGRIVFESRDAVALPQFEREGAS